MRVRQFLKSGHINSLCSRLLCNLPAEDITYAASILHLLVVIYTGVKVSSIITTEIHFGQSANACR